MKKELQINEPDLTPVITKAKELTIASNDDLPNATEILSQLNRENDRIEADRVKLTAPLNATLKEINGRYKPLRELLEASIRGVREKMSRYATLAVKAREEAELKLSERIGEGKGKLKMETAERKISELENVDKTVDTGDGKATFIEVEKFEVVDLAKVPVEYLLANDVAIRKAMKEGVRVEGVRYWKEQSVRNTR